MTPRICAVVPVYNHGTAVGAVVKELRRLPLPVILVDDASAADCAAVLDSLAAAEPGDVLLVRLEVNQGKGGAMMAGFRAAQRSGYTHVLQIDADGQHEPADIPPFLVAARARPEAVICGYPRFDASVPRARLYARYATHVWVWINSLSLAIRDSMCGVRVYPLLPTLAIIDSARLGRRMEFDPEIMVRLHWRGVAVHNLPVRVRYPADGVSHFRLWRDNLLITRMHARLFCGMLARLPALLWRRILR